METLELLLRHVVDAAIVCFEFIGVFVIILAVGGYFIADKNQKTGRAVAGIMGDTIARYELFLEELY